MKNIMKNGIIVSFILSVVMMVAGCAKTLDPLSPGNTDGKYAIGIKALVPLALGNSWSYTATVYDSTSGVEQTRYTYSLSVADTVTADTSKIPLSVGAKKSLTRDALRWYVLQGDGGIRTCWQVDPLGNLYMRKLDDTRFLEQTMFNFGASIGDSTALQYISADTSLTASGAVVVTSADSVKTTLVSKIDTVRTTLGSSPYFKYIRSYLVRNELTTYYFKPGFGLVLMETFLRKNDGTKVRVRRDELVTYYFK